MLMHPAVREGRAQCEWGVLHLPMPLWPPYGPIKCDIMQNMSSDDRFRPDGNQQPHQEGAGGDPRGGQQPGASAQDESQQWAGQTPYSGQTPHSGQYPNQQNLQWTGNTPHTGQHPQGGQAPNEQNLQWSGNSPQTGQYEQSGHWPQQGGPGGPGGPGYPPGQPPQGGYPPKRSRSTAIIAVLVVLILVLVGLGIWWWVGRSSEAEAADGADSATDATTTLVERVNSGDLTTVYDSISPSEKQYASAMTSILMRYSWEAISTDEPIDNEDAQEDITEALGRYSEVVDFSLEIDQSEEVEIAQGMTAVTVTDGTLSLEITDEDEFAEITGDLISQMYSDEQIQQNFGVEDADQLTAMIKVGLQQEGLDNYSADFSEAGPLILVMVEEEKGWYVSPVSSFIAYLNRDYFTDSDYRESFIQRNGEFTMATPEPSSSPEEATERFVDSLSDGSITDSLGYLPLAEQRLLGLAIYLSEVPEIQEVSFGELVALSNLTTTSIEVSDHSALTIINSLFLSLNPAVSGTSMQIQIENEQLTVGTCEPVDISLLYDEDHPALAFALVEDGSGWNVSLVGTFFNFVGAVSSNAENVYKYQLLLDEVAECTAF